MSVFVTDRGEQRWHCHACGAGGTAIDLLVTACSMSVRAAFDDLARRADWGRVTCAPRRSLETARPSSLTAAQYPSPVISAHVRKCAQLLWTDQGTTARAWLQARGFDGATLRRHLVGADPGPRHLHRPSGLPRKGPAAILPVLDTGIPVYFQARYLDPERAGGRKYDNPIAAVAPNPRITTLDPPAAARSHAVFVCEGLLDALSITQHLHRAVAVLGVGLATARLAQQIQDQHADVPIRVAFDTDARGMAARDALLDELDGRGHHNAAPFSLPAGCGDVNDWLRRDPVGLAQALDASVQTLPVPELGLGRDV